ncbi:hypothetical protein VaNZ11_003854 [Volvox africanus]|uniref:FAM192A/Fyv6 N-terminal domain-containing protein n=1 Tax=Volvox africanus TaxID=51714 RepID=A0ABQ5RWL7_9CHLO|nr:hypothetical protein VaNZ11_003854 [Volvox africanus]
MSGRFQTHTVASEGAELDDNYQKMVADIEEQTQRSGWLFGRGAFDKGDLQYLRDFNNSLRYKEVEIEDKEKELWERERARVEAEAAAAAAAQQAAALTRRSSSGSMPGASSGLRGPPGLSSRPAPLLLPVKVKPAGSKHPHTPQSGSNPAVGGLPSCKRARMDPAVIGDSTLSSPLSTTAAVNAAPTAMLPLRSATSEPSPSGALNPHSADARPRAANSDGAQTGASYADGQENCEGHGHQVTSTRSQLTPDLPHADQGPSGRQAHSIERGTGSDGAVVGLATLLGGYGSEDEDEDAREEGVDGSHSGGAADGGDLAGSSHGGSGDRSGGKGSVGGANESGKVQCESGDADGGKAGAAVGETVSKLPPPVGLLNPEELLSDPRVISEGLVATRPQQQDVQGGDAWYSEEAQSSDSDA